jgi:hypothetical protein
MGYGIFGYCTDLMALEDSSHSTHVNVNCVMIDSTSESVYLFNALYLFAAGHGESFYIYIYVLTTYYFERRCP